MAGHFWSKTFVPIYRPQLVANGLNLGHRHRMARLARLGPSMNVGFLPNAIEAKFRPLRQVIGYLVHSQSTVHTISNRSAPVADSLKIYFVA